MKKGTITDALAYADKLAEEMLRLVQPEKWANLYLVLAKEVRRLEKMGLNSKKTDQASDMEWRKLLWFHHGCSIASLYGDDGEMQCNSMMNHAPIDFKRDSVDTISDKFLRFQIIFSPRGASANK